MMLQFSDRIVDDSGYRRPVFGASVYLLKADGTVATNFTPNPQLTNNFGAFAFTGPDGSDGIYTYDARIGGVTIAKGEVIIGAPDALKGPTGPANSTFSTMAAIAATPITNLSAIYAPADGIAPKTYTWVAGNFTGRNDVIASATVPLAQGAWVPPSFEALVNQTGPSLHTAINAAFASGVRTVLLPPGNFTISESCQIPTGCRVRGSGKDTVITASGNGGFQLYGDAASVSDLSMILTETFSFGGVTVINSGPLRDLLVENIWLTWGSGAKCNGMTFVASGGIDGMVVRNIRGVGYPRMLIEVLNQRGADTSVLFKNFSAENVVGINPTGIWSQGQYGNKLFTPLFSLDGSLEGAVLSNCYVLGSTGTAIEIIGTNNTRIVGMKTEGCSWSLLASTNAATTNFTVEGWKDKDPVGRVFMQITSLVNANLNALELPQAYILLGPSRGVRFDNPRLSLGTDPASVSASATGLIFHGSGAGGGDDFEVTGGFLDVSTYPSPASAVVMDAARAGVSFRGTRLKRKDTTQGFIIPQGSGPGALTSGLIYQTGNVQSLTGS